MKRNFSFRLDEDLVDEMKTVTEGSKPWISNLTHAVTIAFVEFIERRRPDTKVTAPEATPQQRSDPGLEE